MTTLPSTDLSEWFYVNPKESAEDLKGPVSIRDLDVLWRTSELYSTSLLWKEGMDKWLMVNDIPELREQLMEGTKEMLKINQALEKPSPRKMSIHKKNHLEKDEIIEKDVEKIVAHSSYQTAEGLWHVFDHEKNCWKTQAEDPKQEFDIEELKKIEKLRKKTKKAAEKKKRKWYEPKINANVYVKGLPEDIEMEEIKEFFSKAGVIRADLKTGEQRIKLYKDEQNRFKGDALISFLKEESVELAIEMLDQREIKPGFKVAIERAKFQQKGDYVPRKKVEIDKLILLKQKQEKEKMLSWDDGDNTDDKGLKIVVLTNVFTLEEAESEPNYFKDLENDIRIECEEKIGPIHRMKIFESNPSGVIQIKFKKSTDAENCIKLMNGRFFSKRKLECFYFDGKTNYDVKISVEEEEKRLDEFGKWLEQQK